MDARERIDKLIIEILTDDLKEIKAVLKTGCDELHVDDIDYHQKLKKALKRVLHYYGVE